MGSPKFIILLFNFYFFAIKFTDFYMRNRQPFDLKIIIRIYNIFQIFTCIGFSIYLNVRVGYETFSSTWKCMKFEERNFTRSDLIEVFGVQWWFMIFRSTDLLETIFFVLRKKKNQVSFLHIYHHVSTLVLLFLMNRYSASEYEGVFDYMREILGKFERKNTLNLNFKFYKKNSLKEKYVKKSFEI